VDIEKIKEIVEVSLNLKRSYFDREAQKVLEAGRRLAGVLRSGHKILAFGNGGSAADAQHFSSELVNRYVLDRRALPAMALTTDTSTLTSVANDSDYRFVFSRQVEAFGAAGDAALAISTSGNSANVLEAVDACRNRGLVTVGLSGRDGGQLVGRVDLCLTVSHRETARIQEVHAMIVHLLCQIIEEELCAEDR
jgi:D-sedoheptulose 7-phosphate isomerase